MVTLCLFCCHVCFSILHLKVFWREVKVDTLILFVKEWRSMKANAKRKQQGDQKRRAASRETRIMFSPNTWSRKWWPLSWWVIVGEGFDSSDDLVSLKDETVFTDQVLPPWYQHGEDIVLQSEVTNQDTSTPQTVSVQREGSKFRSSLTLSSDSERHVVNYYAVKHVLPLYLAVKHASSFLLS